MYVFVLFVCLFVCSFVCVVKQKLQDACKSSAQKDILAVVVSSSMGCEGVSEPIPNFDNSRIEVSLAYDHQNHETCQFVDPTKAEVVAIFQAIAQGDYLNPFKCFICHYIGHGLSNHISLKDGYLSVWYLRSMLSASKVPHLRHKIRGLICDCCRVDAVVRTEINHEPEDNLFVYFTVPYGIQTHVVGKSGMTIATIQFMKLMKGKKTYTIMEFFQEHYDAVQRNAAAYAHNVDYGKGFTTKITDNFVMVRGKTKLYY